jgi:hypothetical protein
VTRKNITAKEAKIEREAFESIFGKDAKCYENPAKSPVKVDNTPSPTPVASDGEDEPPSPEIEIEDLIIALEPDIREVTIKK